MSKEQLILSVRWMIDQEIFVCRIFKSHLAPAQREIFLRRDQWTRRRRGLSFAMVKVGVINLALYKVIKHLIGRPRPCAISAKITVGTAPLDQYSFPSGHTMHAVAFSIVAMAHHAELAWVLVPFSSLIALSRMVLGLHYPTDVIAGGLIGGYVATVLTAW